MRIAIIGAGISGLSCAEALGQAHHALCLFDKGRGPGGRMSTRRAEVDGRTLSFDHGAQYFTTRDAGFAAEVAGWERDGQAARWPAAGAEAWVGTPAMNAPIRAIAGRHPVAWGSRVEAISRIEDGWRLAGVKDEGRFDAVLLAVPAEQAVPLLAPHQPAFAAAAEHVRSAPCWTVMAAFAQPLGTAGEILRDAGAIGWAARNGSKPGRANDETWVIQASPSWSMAHLEARQEEVARQLLALFAAEMAIDLPPPIHLSAHRWLYARSGADGAAGALWDATLGLGACGDWLAAPRVEAAWLSGRKLGTMIGAAELWPMQ